MDPSWARSWASSALTELESRNRRRGQRQRQHGDEQPGFLKKLTVTSVARKRYEASYADVVRFLGRSVPTAKSMEAWDRALEDYIEKLYLAGDRITVARYAFHGVAFVNEWPRRDPSLMPRSRLALLGFARSSPEHCRDPPCLEQVFLAMNDFLDRAIGDQLLPYAMAAAHAWLSVDCYLRPSEGLSLVGAAVSRPRRGAAAQGWALTIAPRGGPPAKNKRFDASVVVGAHDRGWACDLLALLAKDLPADKPLFRGLSLELLEKMYREMSKALGFPMVAHGLRHVGPSHDSLVHKVSVEDIQQRGRWVSLESCRIYTKPASLIRSLARVSDENLRQARRLREQLPARTLSVVSEALSGARRAGNPGICKRGRS